jgi:hypothetical protein
MKKILLISITLLVGIMAMLFFIAYLSDKPTEPTPPIPPQASTSLYGTLLYADRSKTAKALPIAAAQYRINDQIAQTNAQGQFQYQRGDTIQFQWGQYHFNIAAKATMTLSDLVTRDATQSANLMRLLANLDQDQRLENGIQLGEKAETFPLFNLNLTAKQFERQLYLQLGKQPKLAFIPTIGINLEAPQAKADTVGQAMPFVDIFRTARPFQELSPKGVKYDQYGWPIYIPAKQFARTKLLQGTLQDAIPNGEYTVFYEGQGKLSFGADALQKITPIEDGVIKLHLKTKDATAYTEANSLSVVINATDPNDPIRNIRIVMPDGICRDANQAIDAAINTVQFKDNPFLRVSSANQCPAETKYVSFADLLRNQRNHIVFNPDYLHHLRNFRVIRMMNFMEASPSYQCRNLKETAFETCIKQSITWENRAILEDAVWGGSSRSGFQQHKGVPIEVLAALANQLDRDPWFSFAHYADDEYIEKFAQTMQQSLQKHLKPHLEYANETWNPGFQAHYFVKQKGIATGLNQAPDQYRSDSNRTADYFAQLHYYVRRSLEIFTIWNTVFAEDKQRLVKIISGQQGDTVLSEEMLKYQNASEKVDALAIAPYFFGCIERSTTHCTLSSHVLSTVQTVDDIFDIIDHGNLRITGDPSALQGTLEKITRQAKIAKKYNVQLKTYEAGQHLTIMGSMGRLEQSRKEELRALFRQANRDPRMKERYSQFVNHWKSLANNPETANTGLLTLYTMAQSYYDYGSWGLKEWLGQEREQAIKYDAVMQFQEDSVICWWRNCL